MPNKTYEVTFKDIKNLEKSSADYRQVVEPLYREEATKCIQSFFRHYKKYKELSEKNAAHADPDITRKMHDARSKMIDKTMRMKKLQEPIDIRFAAELAEHIKNNEYHLINYAEPDFTRHLFAALRTGQISMNEMMTAKLMFESLTCFNKGKMPKNPAKCFSMFALDDEGGPYRPQEEISHWTEAQHQQLKEQISGKKQNNQYYTINLPHHQVTGFLYEKLGNLGKKDPSIKLVSMLGDYFNSAHFPEEDINRALSYLYDLSSGDESESESAIQNLKKMIQTHQPNVTEMMESSSLNDELKKERSSILFLLALDQVQCQVPSICRSFQYDESDPDSPILSFVLPTIDTFNTLQSVAHGEDSTIPIAVVGQETVRMIRAYDEIPSLKTEASEAQNVLKTLYPMAEKMDYQSRPIEITHPDTEKNKTPHNYNCHDFLLSWHDLFHAWRNGSNYKPLIRKLRGLHDEKNGLAKNRSGMSEVLWKLTDADFSAGKILRDYKNTIFLESFELSTLIHLLDKGGFDFTKQQDDNYLFTYSCAKFADEWCPLIDLTTLSYYAAECPGAPEFFKQKEATENYLQLHPEASITEVILNDLLEPKIESDTALLDSLRSRGYQDIFYWSQNTGLYFKESFIEQHAVSLPNRKLRSCSPDEIRAILTKSVDNINDLDNNAASFLAVDLPLKSRVLQPDPLKRVIEYAMTSQKPQLFIDLIEGGNDLINVQVAFNYNMMTPIDWAISKGQIKLLKHLLMKSTNKNEANLAGGFRFINSSSEKAPEILKILVENGANRNEYIAYAVNNDIPQLLIDLINDGNNLHVTVPSYVNGYRDEPITTSPIEWAIKNDHVELINRLLAKFQYTNNRDSQGMSFIGFMIDKSNYPLSQKTPEILEILLGRGVDINEKNNDGETILYKAVKNGYPTETDIEITNHLIALGATVDVVNNEGKTPLHYTVHPMLAKIMTSNGANVNKKDHDGKTPLEVILEQFNFLYLRRTLKETVSLLIDGGADPASLTSEGKIMIQDRLKKEYEYSKSADPTFCENLLKMISNDDLLGFFSLIFAQGNLQNITALLKRMAKDEDRDRLWATVDETIMLNTAVKCPELFPVIPANLLLKAMTNNNHNQGFSRLHTAAVHDHKSCVAMVLSLPEALQIKALLSRSKHGQSVLSFFIKAPDLLAAISDNVLIAVIRDNIESGDECLATDEQRTEMFHAIKDKIPGILKTNYKLLEGDALNYLTHEQRTTITGIKKLMDGLERMASPADITAFASALMSDDHVKIKTQFDLLFKNTNQPDALKTALSNLQPDVLETFDRSYNHTFFKSHGRIFIEEIDEINKTISPKE